MTMGRVGYTVILVIMLSITTTQSRHTVEKADYKFHPCRRDCLASSPMVCEYNFTVEHYQTLSRACYNCPFNKLDCFRPHCVPADGVSRAIKVVNRMMPGPGIHVCRGDVVVVNVYNDMNDFEGTAIHWHGILQHGSPHMDGVAMITQCPITAHSSFQYRFVAGNSGTHFWHAHAGLQRGDGIFGPLVVRDTQTTSVMQEYDVDLPEHSVIVHDWLEELSSSRFAVHHHAMGDNQPRSILINGRGALEAVQPMNHDMAGAHAASEAMAPHGMAMPHNMTTTPRPHMTTMMNMHQEGVGSEESDDEAGHNHMSGTDGDKDGTYTPYTVFRVSHGKRYRFRFISNGILNCPLRVSIDNHSLVVIASDGYDVSPEEISSFNIFAGERYDVVVRANQPMGNYWVRVEGLGDCGAQYKAATQTAILRYHHDSATAGQQEQTTHHRGRGVQKGKHLNPVHKQDGDMTVTEMKSSEDPPPAVAEGVVKKFFIAMDFNPVENSKFVDPELYPLATMIALHPGAHSNHLYALQMNHITFSMPHAPPLSQYNDLTEELFCNESWPARECRTEFCECVHRVSVGVGDVVELVLVGEARHGMGNHPMHLHGHFFWVLAMQKLNASVTREYVERLDADNKIARNLKNPPRKDTVMVPDGGFTVIRFRADNPGFWLFHCHVDFHFALGMALVVQVGQPHEMPATPRGFPRCGNWKYEPEDVNAYVSNTFASSSCQTHVDSVLVLCALLAVMIHVRMVS